MPRFPLPSWWSRAQPGALGAALVGCAAVVVIVAIWAWASKAPDLSSDDARQFAVRGLAAAGHPGATVTSVTAGTYTVPAGIGRGGPGADSAPTSGDGGVLDVWTVALQVGGVPVELKVRADGDKAAVLLNDYRADASTLLTPDEFEQLRAFRYDPPGDRLRGRRMVGTVAAVLLVGLCAVSLWARSSNRAPDPAIDDMLEAR